jgi:excisionase family DNA binding protein
MENANSTWLTPHEAAKFLGVSRSKLYAMIRAHEVPAAPLPGRGYRLNAASLNEWLKARERGGSQGGTR